MSKKGENIYKRKDGRWEARYIKGYQPDGKAIYGYCYAATYAGAKEKSNLMKAAVINGTDTGNPAKTRLSCLCDEWLMLRENRVKQSTFVKYRTVIENRIKPGLGNAYIRSLNPLAVDGFSRSLIADGLSVKTVRDILTLLHAVLTYGAKRFPSLRNLEIAYPREERHEMRVLSREEQERFTEYLLTDTDLARFGTLLALLTGMRIGEICALRWGDIFLDDGIIRVAGTMQRLKGDGGTKIVITDPKSFSSFRMIPLGDSALALCRRFAVADPDAYILTGTSGKFMEPRTLQYRLRNYTAACGLDGVHFHSLRHSFATRCIEAGFEIKSLSEVLGHASPQITLERYVHSSMELKRENMNKLPKLGF